MNVMRATPSARSCGPAIGKDWLEGRKSRLSDRLARGRGLRLRGGVVTGGQAAQSTAQIQMVPELRCDHAAQAQALEFAKVCAAALGGHQLAIAPHRCDVEIARPLKALLADEFAHESRRVDQKAVGQR